MTPEEPSTAPMEEVNQAAVRVGTRQHRLEWAVQFAQEGLGTLSLGQRLDRSIEVKAFLMLSGGIGGDPDAIDLPSDAAMQAMQQEFKRIIEKVLQEETVDLGRHRTTTSLIWIRGKPYYVQIPELDDRPHDEVEVYQASLGLARLIGELYREGRVIKVCDAPKPRAPAEERCGRWFVGRPNQTFCSPSCRNLANTRATRAKPQQRARRQTPGTK
jgi:hypothetical protein